MGSVVRVLTACVFILGLLAICNCQVASQDTDETDPINFNAFRTLGSFVSYKSQNFPRESPAPLVARAKINQNILNARIGSSTTDSQNIKPRGYRELEQNNIKWNRCHMIGNQLGGSGSDARNLFACPANANSPVMRHYESLVRRYIEGKVLGGDRSREVWLEVTLTYSTSRGYPTTIQMTAHNFNLRPADQLLFDVIIRNNDSTGAFAQPCLSGRLTAGKPQSGAAVPPSISNAGKWRYRNNC